MNKFQILPCAPSDEEKVQGGGYHAPLRSITDPALVIFFPIPEDSVNVINCFIAPETVDQLSIPGGVVGAYQMMTASWGESGRYVSGIIFDSEYDIEMEQEIVSPSLYLSDFDSGMIEGIVPVSVAQALVIASMNGYDVTVTSNLLMQLLPGISGIEQDDLPKKSANDYENDGFAPMEFPVDPALKATALKIVKNTKRDDEDSCDDEDSESSSG